MYNRYIPQNDGTYRRNFVPDRPAQPPQQPKKEQPIPCPIEPPEPECPKNPGGKEPSCPRRCANAGCRGNRGKNEPEHREKPRQDGNILDFLRNLLPKEFDTGDLLVVLLLLLMAGDCKEDQNSALLTLVLYLFM